MKFWKYASISLVVILVLVGGTAVALAQDVDETPPPAFGPGFVDEDGDGICDVCGQVPGSGYGQGGMRGRGGFAGSGMMGFNNRGGAGGYMGGFMNGNTLYELAAQTLGIELDEVWAELAAGISLAELAANHDVDVQVIVDAHLAEHEAALNEAVAAGQLSQEQANLMLAQATTNIEARVNQPFGGPGQGNGQGFGGRGSCMGGGVSGGFGPGQRGARNFAPQGNGA